MRHLGDIQIFRRLYHSSTIVRGAKSLLTLIVSKSDFRKAKQKLLFSDDSSDCDKALLDSVNTLIHYKDGMYMPMQAKHYLTSGLSAIGCIDKVLKQRNRQREIRTILDFPSGYGRVLRFLKIRFPDAEITAIELDKTAIRFCRKTFSVTTLESNTNLKLIPLTSKFDLIWCGSLLTHLDEKASAELLKFFSHHLASGGVCVFTTHGRQSIELIEQGKISYGLTKSREGKILADFYKQGYGYCDYSNSNGYGIAVASHIKMIEIAGSSGFERDPVFLEAEWDNHQDVYGFTLLTNHDADNPD